MYNILYDAGIMFKRCLLTSLRNPEALAQSTIVPFLMMLLFDSIFGTMVNLSDMNYIDFIVPGIVLQSIAQASQYTAMNVTADMTMGIIDRFRSMSISRSALLIGHAGAGTVRSILTSVVIIITALVLGFRPQGTLMDYVVCAGILILFNIAISLTAVLLGLLSKTVAGTVSLILPLIILPFISSGFAPVESLSGAIRWFAQVQPMTPIIDSFRALTLDIPIGNSLTLSLIWCVGIILVTYILSLQVYKKRT